MFKGFRVIRRQKETPRINPEIAGALAELLMKLIGETVKDRAWRAALAAIVTALTAYFAPSIGLPSWESSSQPSSEQARPSERATQLGNGAGEDRPGLPIQEVRH